MYQRGSHWTGVHETWYWEIMKIHGENPNLVKSNKNVGQSA
jgi:hypothetical protein